MDKFSFISLWDAYGALLTPNRQEITNLYFNLDLTVTEIAEEKGISRQAVSECLKDCKKQLEEYEEKLNFLRRMRENSREFSQRISKARRAAESLKAARPEITEEIDEIINVLGDGCGE